MNGQQNVAVLDLSFIAFRFILGNTHADKALPSVLLLPAAPPAAPARAAHDRTSCDERSEAQESLTLRCPSSSPKLRPAARPDAGGPVAATFLEPWCVARGQKSLVPVLSGKQQPIRHFSVKPAAFQVYRQS